MLVRTIVVFLMLIASSCSASADAPSDPPRPAPPLLGSAEASQDAPRADVVALDVDRVFASTLAELLNDSDLVVSGTLGDAAHELSRSTDDRFLHMAHPFLIEEVIRGAAQPGESIEVLRTVASDGRPAVEFNAEPTIVGERYLLFLRAEGDVYVTSGGPQGQFAIENDRLKSLTDELPSFGLAGLALDEVAAFLNAKDS
jgi:hypothetical protein